MATVLPIQDTVLKALGDFIAAVLPVALPVIQLDENRVAAPPPAPGFVGMRWRTSERIMTNLDRWDYQSTTATTLEVEQAVKATVQLDFYGASSGDWATIIATLLRDEYAVAALKPAGVSPLYAGTPKFAPLANGEEQYERRWIVDAVLQYNPVVTVPQQFADTAEVGLINVDERYPPS